MIEDTKKIVWYKSFAATILFWFLPLSIAPMLLFSYYGNNESVKILKKYAFYELQQSSTLESRFIENWFHYRELDINNWSNLFTNIDFLAQLREDFSKSATKLNVFVKSETFMDTSISLSNDLNTIFKQYDYVNDLFLIDMEGNILFSVEKKSDFGTNLLHGKYSKTKFASAFVKTVKDKKNHFSDLELYEPSNHSVAGFLTAPLVYDGEMIGVLAVQLKLDTIYKSIEGVEYADKIIENYIVGEDGLLRSKIKKDEEILHLEINNKLFKNWQIKYSNLDNSYDEKVHIYSNLYNLKVFGIHHNLNILGVKWVLISESDMAYITNATDGIVKKAFIYFLIMLVILIIGSLLISKKIVQPILYLSEATRKFTKGNSEKVDINIQNEGEIGVLAENFRKMMNVLNEQKQLLVKQTKEAHNALHDLDEQKFALDAHSIVAITDIKGNITYVNDKFVEISGYLKEELLGKNHRMLNSGLHDKEFWKQMYKRVSSGKIWNHEVCNIAKNGNYYWVDTTVVPFINEENNKVKSYVVLRTDITQQKLLQERLEKAKEVAEESVKAKAEFLASMSHEIRTPMNGVIGMLRLLMHTHLSESQHHQAYLAQSSAKALLSIINDILDFSKIEAGKLELDITEFDIHKEFGDFAEAIAFRAQEKDVELVLDISEINVNYVRGDIGRIRQVLNNVVGNSIKFTSKGHILIKASLSQENTRLHICVKDTGIGIPGNKIATLFDSFSQVDASTTRKYGGTGLGLAIVKKLCELMGGRVQVFSTLGEGSSFDIEIALGISVQATTVKPIINLEDKKALIIDESSISTEVLKKQLEKWGMQVEHVMSTQKALNIADESYAIAFIDKDIKSLSAEVLADTFKKNEHQNSIKLVIMTSVSDRRDRDIYKKHGYDAYFPKPMTTSDIFNALNVLVEDFKGLQNSTKTLQIELVKEYKWPENTRILLVDDNKVNQLVANGLLEEFNLEADVVNNGQEALNALINAKNNPYTIVLMDCQMPVMDGYEATRRIKAGETGLDNSMIPVIAMTANAMDGDKEKCFAAGMDDYISKPINPDILEEKLKKYLLKDV